MMVQAKAFCFIGWRGGGGGLLGEIYLVGFPDFVVVMWMCFEGNRAMSIGVFFCKQRRYLPNQ